MSKNGHVTIIRNLKINNISHGASINNGASIHKGHQANAKINNGEIVIGDEFSFGCPEEEESENENNEAKENNPKRGKKVNWRKRSRHGRKNK